MVEPVFHRAQTGFDVAKTLAPRQLRESHCEKLIHAGEATMSPVAAVAADTAMKFVSGKVVNHLAEDGAAGVHAPLSASTIVRQGGRKDHWEFKSKTMKGGPNLSSIS